MRQQRGSHRGHQNATGRIRSAASSTVHQPPGREARERVREPQDEEHEADGSGGEAPLVREQGEKGEDHALGDQATDRHDPPGPDARVAPDVGKLGARPGVNVRGALHRRGEADH